MARNERAMSRIVWDMQTRFFIWHNFSYIYLKDYMILMSPYTCLVYLAAYSSSYSTYKHRNYANKWSTY